MQYTGAHHHGWIVKKMDTKKYPVPGMNSYVEYWLKVSLTQKQMFNGALFACNGCISGLLR